MRTVCKYDSSCDIQEVDQIGYVDLNRSIEAGFVPNDLGSFESQFDGEEVDPESLLGKPSDRFEAMRMQESLAKGITDKVKADKAKAPKKPKTENS